MDQDAVFIPPYVTAELPGTGGVIKEKPEDFVVEEIPLYEPRGEGGHMYIRIQRQGMNTRDLQSGLARAFGLKNAQVGCAGLKDKHAVTTQTFSLELGSMTESEAARRVEENLPVRVLGAKRHSNKLKRGHLLGNRFEVLVCEPCPNALEAARGIAEELAERGMPNFFGEQRFGAAGDNAARGREALLGQGPRKKWLRVLLLSAYQSSLFNRWLAMRMKQGLFDRLLAGDIAKKTDTGGLFTVEEPAIEQPRMDAGEITYTGPIYGGKMRWAQDEAGAMEQEILREEGLEIQDLKKAGLKGTRRAARLFIPDLEIEKAEAGIMFRFALPKGSYATTLLREFIKPPAG